MDQFIATTGSLVFDLALKQHKLATGGVEILHFKKKANNKLNN